MIYCFVETTALSVVGIFKFTTKQIYNKYITVYNIKQINNLKNLLNNTTKVKVKLENLKQINY